MYIPSFQKDCSIDRQNQCKGPLCKNNSTYVECNHNDRNVGIFVVVVFFVQVLRCVHSGLFHIFSPSAAVHDAQKTEQNLRTELRKQNIPSNQLQSVSLTCLSICNLHVCLSAWPFWTYLHPSLSIFFFLIFPISFRVVSLYVSILSLSLSLITLFLSPPLHR